MERDPMEMALSLDLVMDNVLSHLTVRDLLACRQVSKFWNKAASSVLRKRSTMIKNISEENHLMELQDCIEQSWDFPFAGLIFDQPWRLSSGRAMEFFKNYGAIFTSLKLGTSFSKKLRTQDQAPFINHFPRLSILQMDLPQDSRPRVGKVLESAAGQEDGRILNLRSLRTLRISLTMNEDFLCQVLAAATPSLRIECLHPTYGFLKTLKGAEKLQAVSVIHHAHDQEEVNALRVTQLLSTEAPTLTKLDFGVGGCISQEGLMKLLISSQYTLQDLRLFDIYPSEFLSECPVLTKLTMLILCIGYVPEKYVFQGSQGNKFPALKQLKLGTMYHESVPWVANVSDSLFIVPSLTTINLKGRVDINVIKDLARSFPNVIEIQLNHRHYKNDPSGIWSVGAFKFLEKLKIWDYPLRWSNKSHMNMDRFLTGMCSTICKNLCKHPQQNLIDSPFNEILRKSPSILQLKNLKELVVCMKLEGGLEELPEEPPFISLVSVWYALQMVPNLKARFVYGGFAVGGFWRGK